MAAISGASGYVKEGSTTIAELKEWDLNTDTDLYDTTVFGDSFHEFIAGLRGATGTAQGFWMLSDTGQAALQSAMLGGTTVTLHLSPNGSNEYVATAFIKQV